MGTRNEKRILTVGFLNNKIKGFTEELEMIRDILVELKNREPKTVNDEVRIRYINRESINEIVEKINEKGQKIKTDSYRIESDGEVTRISERAYNSNDVKNIIKNKNEKVEVSSDLVLFSKIMFEYNQKEKELDDVCNMAKKIKNTI